MQKSYSIKRKGTVCSVRNEMIDIELENFDACQACRSQKSCEVSRCSKIITLRNNGTPFKTGEQVMVNIKQGAGSFAVIVSYVVPTVLTIGVIALLSYMGIDEIASAVIALVCCGLYLVSLFLFKKFINQRIQFKVEKVEHE